jgi:hypothetical protein
MECYALLKLNDDNEVTWVVLMIEILNGKECNIKGGRGIFHC